MIPINFHFRSISLAKMEGKNVIFVDFFDTLCFRRIHSSQLYEQWAECLCQKYPELSRRVSKTELIEARIKASCELHKIYEEPSYRQLITKIEEFVGVYGLYEGSLFIDEAIEIGTHYPNKYIIKILSFLKRQGKKIYIISDFYLPKSSYLKFLKHLRCEELIDDVFVSESFNKSKYKGSLYLKVLNLLNLQVKDVVMIGDNKLADVQSAKRNMIESFWYLPLFHKLWTNYSRLRKIDYRCSSIMVQSQYLYKKTFYEEYCVALLYFCHSLYNYAWVDRVKKISFYMILRQKK